MNDELHNLKYWVNQLQKNVTDIEPTRKKLYDTSCAPLSIEESYKLREALTDFGVIATFLNEDLTKLESELKKPLYKKLLRK